MYRWTDNRKKRHYFYASTLSELREKESKIAIEQLFNVTQTSDTLNDRILIYFKTKADIADSTMSNYEFYFNHVIRDSAIGIMRVKNIKKSDILAFYKVMSNEKGYSPGTIKILHKIIHPALELAQEDGIIMKNPSTGCTKEYKDDIEKKYALSLEEEKEFLERIINRPRMKRYYPMYAIMLKTGLRISELIGLTWDDVDMINKEIHINHQIQYRKINGKTHYFASDTKTSAGDRDIPMMDEVYHLFVEQRKIWLATKKDTDFEVDGYKNFVFLSHVTGKCMNHNAIRRMLKNIVAMNTEREIQLPNISPHILRHTACSRLAEAGCDIKVLQYVMGQKDLKITMQVYNHVNSDRIKREMARLEDTDLFTPKFTPKLHKSM